MGFVQVSRLSPKRKPSGFGFTLLELLVVIAIITVLAALLIPVVNEARGRAQAAVCVSNLKNIIAASTAYESDHAGEMPFPGGYSNGWLHVLPAYLGWKETPYQLQSAKAPRTPNVLTCPTQFSSRQSYYTYAMNFRLTKGAGNPDGTLATTRNRALRPGRADNFMPVSASTIPYFMDGHIWDVSGEFRDWRSQDAVIPEATWKVAFPHDDGCNIGYLDGHVARAKRGEGVLGNKVIRYEDNLPAF
jgi:prepilin-type N-terminal cleavage/methylation domain-containing protein/prepilin-type processing-associated H-X9-DG protein